jgi:uncharacterized protein (UPF0335 family)
MTHEDDLIIRQIERLETFGSTATIADILDALLRKINRLEQDVKELKNGGKKK